MGVVGAAGILDFERSYSGWVKDERRPSNPRKINLPTWHAWTDLSQVFHEGGMVGWLEIKGEASEMKAFSLNRS